MPESRLRITKIDELQFLTCLKYKLWGTNKALLADWKMNDQLLFIVDKAIAGLARVAGEPFDDTDPVPGWDGGYPHRVRLEFNHVIPEDKRPPVLGRVRDLLIHGWGLHWGLFAIVKQEPRTGAPADDLLAEIAKQPNALPEYASNLDSLIDEARKKRSESAMKPAPRVPPPETSAAREPATKAEESEHTRHQSVLKELGKLTGCEVWIAANDRNKTFRGKTLGDGCLKALSIAGLDKEALQKVSLIDVIWTKKSAPLYAFEVETTTQVFSGLLRMADLVALVPNLRIELFIVAPKKREGKVMAELSRPIFGKIGLSNFCRFVSTEDLDSLVGKVRGLPGYVQPSVLDAIAVELSTELSAAKGEMKRPSSAWRSPRR